MQTFRQIWVSISCLHAVMADYLPVAIFLSFATNNTVEKAFFIFQINVAVSFRYTNILLNEIYTKFAAEAFFFRLFA